MKKTTKHYNDILNRVHLSTGVDKEILDTICKVFLYETSEEMVDKTIDLPYIGDISLRNKKLDPCKHLISLKKNGGSYCFKFHKKRKILSDM